MEEINEIIKEAIEKMHEIYGDPVLEEGDEQVILLDNCTLILSLENGTLQTKFIGGNPIKIDRSLSLFVEVEDE
jgi:hypothetical protein